MTSPFHSISPEERGRSIALSQRILQLIQQDGDPLPFSQYMDYCLYSPHLGYYDSPHWQLGSNGNFTTAPELTPLFAESIAQAVLPILQEPSLNYFLELGAGTGQFAVDCLTALSARNTLPENYFIYEINLARRLQQQERLQTRLPHLYKKVIWLDELPTSFEGVIFANEVLDAIPCQRFVWDGTTITEQCITSNNQQLIECHPKASQDDQLAIETLITRYNLLPPYQLEYTLPQKAFTHDLTQRLKKGLLLLIDYGYGEAEYYHPSRRTGTLSCYYQHQQHDDPFAWPGLSDISCHVNFTDVAKGAIEADGEIMGFTTQASFLLANQFIESAEKRRAQLSPCDEVEMTQAMKRLLLPSEMGETIKVMGIKKGLSTDIHGFSQQDRRQDL